MQKFEEMSYQQILDAIREDAPMMTLSANEKEHAVFIWYGKGRSLEFEVKRNPVTSKLAVYMNYTFKTAGGGRIIDRREEIALAVSKHTDIEDYQLTLF